MLDVTFHRAEVTGRIMHMLSELRGDAAAVGNIAEATKSRVLQQLLGEISMTDGERLALLEKLLADFVDPKMVRQRAHREPPRPSPRLLRRACNSSGVCLQCAVRLVP